MFESGRQQAGPSPPRAIPSLKFKKTATNWLLAWNKEPLKTFDSLGNHVSFSTTTFYLALPTTGPSAFQDYSSIFFRPPLLT